MHADILVSRLLRPRPEGCACLSLCLSIFVLAYLAATPTQDVPIQAYVSVPAYMHDMHARDSPVSVHVNFRAAVWLV